ncbi:hypothetical protein GCM10012286_13260 [Streptomyces lasiicapitis]|uniref:Uncharacterized protein n=1 Tax=Streptomyces lasiicapitis TaxID=1923961 RepID=A0ABQ2LKH8_9ACTN|nr:hypothetical protein GCM10012286_13260 [Streptomyces lasiicapitis]
MACPGAACHNLAELPGVSGMGPGTPLWHGYLFATLSDQPRHPVQRAPSRRSWLVPGTLAGDRTQGSQHYSIRATRVDRHAAELLMGEGSWRQPVPRDVRSDVASFTKKPEPEPFASDIRPFLTYLA